MPCNKLTIQVRPVFGAQKRCLSEEVLDLRGNLTKLNVFN